MSKSASEFKDNSKFLEQLEIECFNKKISKSKVMRDLGFSSSNTTNWKQGTAKPSLETLEKIAKYFDITVARLIGDETDRAYSITNTGIKPARVGERYISSYESGDMEKSSVTAREIGRFEGRIFELEKKVEELNKKNSEYEEEIKNLNNQLYMERAAKQAEKMPEQTN
ncbi:MAG: helix-turn-helix transcriptional regulator [Chitinispirillales bacterium]|nr:helix-turn-helix transcriptional regulator [Chitinispirillales bacterium]